MRRTQNRRRAKPKTKTAHNQPKGFDFGGERHVVYVGSLSFIESLKAADVVGCAYEIAYFEDLRGEVTIVSLDGRNEKALSEAFKEFDDWSAGSGTQAVESQRTGRGKRERAWFCNLMSRRLRRAKRAIARGIRQGSNTDWH